MQYITVSLPRNCLSFTVSASTAVTVIFKQNNVIFMQNNCIVMTVIIYIATSGHKITSIHYFSSQAPVTSNTGQHAPEQTLCHTTQDKNRTDMDRIEHHVYEWYNMQNAENKVKTKAEHGTESPQSKAHSSTCKIKTDVTLVIYHRHHAPVRLNYYRTVLAIQR